jgi:hypothetical protein
MSMVIVWLVLKRRLTELQAVISLTDSLTACAASLLHAVAHYFNFVLKAKLSLEYRQEINATLRNGNIKVQNRKAYALCTMKFAMGHPGEAWCSCGPTLWRPGRRCSPSSAGVSESTLSQYRNFAPSRSQHRTLPTTLSQLTPLSPANRQNGWCYR